MVLRFAFWAEPEVKKLISIASQFCNDKNIGTNTHNRIVNVPEIKHNPVLNVYELALTVDVPIGIGKQSDNVNVVDNVPFNVTNEKEQEEIQKMQQEEAARKQAAVAIST